MNLFSLWQSTGSSDSTPTPEPFLSSSGNITWATDAYHQFIDPILVANPNLVTLLSTVGVIVIIVQLLTMFSQYKKKGFRSWMIVLAGTTVLSTALIAPQAMLPFWLGLFDFLWDLVFGILDILGIS